MKRTDQSERERLLDEVLNDAGTEAFRADVLTGMLRAAQRRRWRRRASRVALVVSAFVVGGVMAWRLQRSQAGAGEAVGGCAIVQTRMMDFAAVVDTARTTVVVSTHRDARSFRLVNDEELLALAGPRPAVLVRVGPGVKELIFVGDAAGRNRVN